MSEQPVSQRLDPWLQQPAVVALHGALSALAPIERVALVGVAASRWAEVVGSGAFMVDLDALEHVGLNVDAVVVGAPDCLPTEPGEEAAFVAKLVAFGSLVLLATVSPASSTAGHGRWPLYWAERFAPHGWRFVDAIRPAIWNDSLVHPDVKEGALLFVGPRATVPDPPSGASALLHPHRLVEVQRGFNSRLDRFRCEIQERDRADLDALTGEAQGQRQRLLALEARVAAAERRTGLLADGLLHAPCFQPISATRGLRSRVRHLLRAAPVALTAAASLPDLATSSLFDPAYYVEHNPDAAAAPFVHYLAQGEHRGRRPNRYFDPTFYRETQPDVAASGLGMLAHFARYGGFEGRAASPEFDTAWYVSTYRDVGLSGLHPLLHFLAIGQTLGYKPGPAS